MPLEYITERVTSAHPERRMFMFRSPSHFLKKAGATALGAALCFGMAIPAFAAPADSVTITMVGGSNRPMYINSANGSVSGHGTFGAYRIMDLKTSLKEGDSCEGEHSDSCYNYAYSINSKYQSVLNTVAAAADTDGTSGVSNEELLAYLHGMTSDSDEIRTFADSLYNQIKSMGVDATADGEGKFNDIPQGYYLIVETALGSSPDSRSLVMLDTAGQLDMTVNAKEDVPELTKTVADTGSSSFVESVMAGVGEQVTFKLNGTLPSNLNGYQTYKYVFHDTLSAGLAYDEGSFKVKVGDKDVTSFFTADKDCSDGCSVAFRCDNILSEEFIAAAGLNAESEITLTYTATVQSGAVIGNPGNPNTASLEFSNDPYIQSSTDETPDDQANVFAAALEITKTDGSGNPLTGAGFTLSKWNGSSYEAVAAASVSGHVHTFSGLGDGKYKLEETTVPDGYNKADDIIFVIGEATYDGSNAKVAQTLSNFTVKDDEGSAIGTMHVTANTGKVVTTIENRTGSLLPSTGGAGTYLIYGSATILLAGGVVLIMMKKKQNKEQ